MYYYSVKVITVMSVNVHNVLKFYFLQSLFQSSYICYFIARDINIKYKKFAEK